MAKRFGRNQRRKAREDINRLQKANSNLQLEKDFLSRQYYAARAEADTASKRALEEFMHNGHIYKEAILECSGALGVALGKQLNEHKEKLLSIVVENRPLLYFDVEQRIDRGVNVLHVHIPLKELHYRKIVL